MLKPLALRGSIVTSLVSLALAACSSDSAPGTPSAAAGAAAGGSAGAAAGAGGSSAGASAGGAAASGSAGGSGGSVAGAGGTLAGAGGAAAGSGGTVGGAGGSSGSSSMAGAAGSVNTIPTDYKGTPFTALKIPGRINACDYDRGGAGVAWCHDKGNCSAGTVTGDYPQASGIYRPAMPSTDKICSGAACPDNVGVCRMNPSKPDNTIDGQAMPATDTYLCYSVAGEWTKYTVTVEQAGTYAVGGTMAVPQGGAFNLSFSNNITTGDVQLAITSTAHSGSGENYHSWDTRMNLGTVTFPSAGTYLMTLTQVGRFNADNFTFTKK